MTALSGIVHLSDESRDFAIFGERQWSNGQNRLRFRLNVHSFDSVTDTCKNCAKCGKGLEFCTNKASII